MGQIYQMAYPYERTTSKYETDNIIITATNHCSGSIVDIIFNDRIGYIECEYGTFAVITHEFKNNIKVKPTALHLLCQDSDHPAIRVTVETYCYDIETQTEVLLYSKTYDGVAVNASTHNYDCHTELTTNILTSKLITKVKSGNSYPKIQHISYDFEVDQTSKMIKNKVEHVIMQNELFQKVTSNAEIISD